MLWLRLIEGILDLNISKDKARFDHEGDKTSIDFLTIGKLRFTVEVVGDQVTLVFREYGAEPIGVAVFSVRKIRSISIRGQEKKVIDRISKILRAKRMYISFEEINNKELAANHERKLVWN